LSAAPAFTAPRWLRGAHAQTIYASKFCPQPQPAYRRERWHTPDGDFVEVDFIDAPDAGPHTPWLVLFHGLEGSSRSHYARRLMHAVEHRGWHGVVVHFRGCSGEPNRLPRAYHSGDSQEIDWILSRLHTQGFPALFVAGVSLGGNALLKWLAEQGPAASRVITAAAAVSAPLDLAAANVALSSGFNLVYARHFLRTLIPAARAKDRRFPGRIDLGRALQARSLGEFDDAVTAPLHGFLGVDDYYARSSAGPLLGAIETPALLLHAANDPFLPAAALPHPDQLPVAVTLEIHPHGGHVGFVHGSLPGRIDWLPQRLLAHFAAHLPAACRMR
jgi:predicted alpha/beta-fold hydrolase